MAWNVLDFACSAPFKCGLSRETRLSYKFNAPTNLPCIWQVFYKDTKSQWSS